MNIMIIILLGFTAQIVLGGIGVFYYLRIKKTETRFYKCLSFSAAYILSILILSTMLAVMLPAVIAMVLTLALNIALAYFLSKYYFLLTNKKTIWNIAIIWLIFIFLTNGIVKYLILMNTEEIIAPDNAKSMLSSYFLLSKDANETLISEKIEAFLKDEYALNYTLKQDRLMSRKTIAFTAFLPEDNETIKKEAERFLGSIQGIENKSIFVSYSGEKYLIKPD